MNSETTQTSIFVKLLAVVIYLSGLLIMTAYFLVFLMPSAVVLDKIVPTNVFCHMCHLIRPRALI